MAWPHGLAPYGLLASALHSNTQRNSAAETKRTLIRHLPCGRGSNEQEAVAARGNDKVASICEGRPTLNATVAWVLRTDAAAIAAAADASVLAAELGVHPAGRTSSPSTLSPSTEMGSVASLCSTKPVGTGAFACARRNMMKAMVTTAATMPKAAPTFLGVSGIVMSVPKLTPHCACTWLGRSLIAGELAGYTERAERAQTMRMS